MSKKILVVSILSIAAFAGGCSSEREIEVSGEAKAPATGTLSAPIRLQFFDEIDPAKPATTPALEVMLEKAGPFTQKVTLRGDKVRIFALSDANKSGACDGGEPWSSVEADVNSDGKVAPVTLALGTTA